VSLRHFRLDPALLGSITRPSNLVQASDRNHGSLRNIQSVAHGGSGSPCGAGDGHICKDLPLPESVELAPPLMAHPNFSPYTVATSDFNEPISKDREPVF